MEVQSGHDIVTLILICLQPSSACHSTSLTPLGLRGMCTLGTPLPSVTGSAAAAHNVNRLCAGGGTACGRHSRSMCCTCV
jgi:hypothetical protein